MPRNTLTRDQIVQAALALLDAEGLENFSMRALGAKLGSAATAVYWHVGNKDNLIALAADELWQKVPAPDLSTTDWRTAAREMAVGLHTVLVRHPWMVQAFGAHPIFGRGKARHDDHMLAVYEKAGLRGAEADQAAAAVFTFVLGNALGPAAQDSLLRKPDGERLIEEAVAGAAEIAQEFPRLRDRLSGADYAAAPDDTFEFGLDAILDGLAARITRTSTTTEPTVARRKRA